MYKINLVGKQFARLKVVEYCGENKSGMSTWKCICECGKETIVPTNQLNNGHTKSCGCLSKDVSRTRMTTHGLRNTQLYKVWAGIKDRTNPKNHNNKNNYKKLNITMCDEWRNDFMSFYKWSMEHGYREEKLANGRNKYEIDRINTYGNYEPSNCRWITQKEQMNNQTTNKLITYNGKTQTLAQWRDELGFDYGLVEQRLWNGWSVERAFTESADKQKYYEYKGEMLNINQIAERTGLTRKNVCNRIFRGWDMERLMTQKPRIIRRKSNV